MKQKKDWHGLVVHITPAIHLADLATMMVAGFFVGVAYVAMAVFNNIPATLLALGGYALTLLAGSFIVKLCRSKRQHRGPACQGPHQWSRPTGGYCRLCALPRQVAPSPTPSPRFVFWFHAAPAVLIAAFCGLLLASWGDSHGLKLWERAWMGAAPLIALGLLLQAQWARRLTAAKVEA